VFVSIEITPEVFVFKKPAVPQLLHVAVPGVVVLSKILLAVLIAGIILVSGRVGKLSRSK
jgi:hypothetical protein